MGMSLQADVLKLAFGLRQPFFTNGLAIIRRTDIWRDLSDRSSSLMTRSEVIAWSEEVSWAPDLPGGSWAWTEQDTYSAESDGSTSDQSFSC